MPSFDSASKHILPDPWAAHKPQAPAPQPVAAPVHDPLIPQSDVKQQAGPGGGGFPAAAASMSALNMNMGGGGWEGAAKGAAVGTAVGTLFGPFGTILGGVIGGVAGGLLSGKDGKKDEKLDPAQKPKITEEERKQAEVARDALGKSLEKIELSPAKRDQILAQCKGLSGDALVEHMRIIEHALKTDNADRALSAYADITKMASEDKKHGDRISTDVLGSLVSGVADRRTESDRGQEGILGAKQAREATEALLKMSDGDYKRTVELMEKSGKDADGKLKQGADAGAEKSLLLQALAARRDDFKNGDAKKAAKDMDDLAAFAGDIRGTDRKELIRTTTAIDVDDENTSTLNPSGMTTDDKRADNDGLFQRYTQACGPTTAQMTKAAADPIYARALHKSGFNDPGQDNQAAKEQKEILERLGGADGTPDQAISRLGQKARTDFSTDSKALLKSGSLSDADFKALRDYADGKDLAKGKEGDLNKALEKMRAANKGHPTEAEMKAMRDNSTLKEGDGMYLDDALNDHTKPVTHVDYTYHATQDATGKIKGSEMDTWADKLRDGQDVPLRVGWNSGGGHFMTCTDVRGKGDARRFLISDPWTGVTAWVPEKSIKDGSWTKTFDGGPGALTHIYYE
jgi:hypothetical protein